MNWEIAVQKKEVPKQKSGEASAKAAQGGDGVTISGHT